VKREKEIQAECNSCFMVNLVASFKDSAYLYMLLECIMGGELFTYLQVTLLNHTHLIPCLTVWDVEPDVAHQTSLLDVDRHQVAVDVVCSAALELLPKVTLQTFVRDLCLELVERQGQKLRS